MSDDGAMTRDEAVAALGQRYRLRIVCELRHAERGAVLPASTMVETPAALPAAAATLVALMVPRLLARLAGSPEREEEEP